MVDVIGVIEQLRQNDPARTRIWINLCDETSDGDTDADLAKALEQNPFVTAISFYFGDWEQQTDWNHLLRVIAMRTNLETVTFYDAVTVEERTAPAALLRSILQAIQQNTAIRNVELDWLRLPTDISTFLDNMPSITLLSIYGCDMEFLRVSEQGARSLAVALQRNTNIETLKLSGCDIYAVSILEGLRLNTAVKSFTFFPSRYLDATSHALHHLLESTTSIQKFELHHATFSERQFPLIAQAITGSEYISALNFVHCGFQDRNNFAQLQSILLNKRNLTSLCLDECDFGRGQLHGGIISTLLRPDSSLRCFEFYCQELEQTIPVIQFENLLRAMKKSKLERFQIGSIVTPHYMQVLIQSIPSMKLRELKIDFWADEEGEFSREPIRQDLLQAVGNNFSLRSVQGDNLQDDEPDFFETAAVKQRLAFYANRNECFDQWVDNPKTVKNRKVWPEALSLAERAGPNALFRGLHSVLQSDYGSLPRGRKRKRPRYYAPP